MSDVPLTQKIALTSGSDFWHTHAVPEAGLPAILVTDGPHGVRKQAGGMDHIGLNDSVPSTCFPPAVGLASTWNRDLLRRVGEALGDECRALDVGILLGPGVNLKRSPLCGRNFEYFSEDPFLTGELAVPLVQGVQSRGVGTSLKHFAANNQETDRMRRDSQMDERTLRELYLRAFAKVVTTAQPWTVMSSYNRINGVYASQNHELLTRILREEWGFEGFVVSDWGAVTDPVASLQAGLDLEMPPSVDHAEIVAEAIADGRLSEEVLDRAYERLVRVLQRAARTGDHSDDFDAQAHHHLAREAAREAIVLLENDGVLPLARETNVAVIGEFARTPRYQGAGSSRVNPTRLDSALEAITALLGRDVPFAPGFTTDPARPAPADAHEQAVAVAATADVVLLFLGLGEQHESEGYDRDTMTLPEEQLRLLDDVLAVNDDIVVVLSNGSSVLVSSFAHRVRAVVEGWLLGQAGGSAMADVLYGVVSPSGKITETIPRRLEDVPSFPHFPGDRTGVRYGEGLFVGYRGYDVRRTDVAYPFGHGLSYTTFAYSDLEVTAGAHGLVVELTVTNTGETAGREVVQVYVSVRGSSVERPPQELKGFDDVTLDPGAAARMAIPIAMDDLATWSMEQHSWFIERGNYIVAVGASSRDIRLRGEVRLDGNEPARELTLQTTVAEALADPAFAEAASSLGGLFMPTDAESDAARMIADIPLLAIATFSGQSPKALEAILREANAQRAAN